MEVKEKGRYKRKVVDGHLYQIKKGDWWKEKENLYGAFDRSNGWGFGKSKEEAISQAMRR
jgi:hypothetical protein